MSPRSKVKGVASTLFSDFIRNASPTEKKRVYTAAMKKASARQNAEAKLQREELTAAIAAGLASGPGKSTGAVLDRLETKYRKLAGKRVT